MSKCCIRKQSTYRPEQAERSPSELARSPPPDLAPFASTYNGRLRRSLSVIGAGDALAAFQVSCQLGVKPAAGFSGVCDIPTQHIGSSVIGVVVERLAAHSLLAHVVGTDATLERSSRLWSPATTAAGRISDVYVPWERPDTQRAAINLVTSLGLSSRPSSTLMKWARATLLFAKCGRYPRYTEVILMCGAWF